MYSVKYEKMAAPVAGFIANERYDPWHIVKSDWANWSLTTIYGDAKPVVHVIGSLQQPAR